MTLLPDEDVFYTKTWNDDRHVPGFHFIHLPTFVDFHGEERDANRSKITERSRAVSRCAIGRLQECAPYAKMKERPPPIRVIERWWLISGGQATIIRQLCEDVQMTVEKHQDGGAGDFLAGILERHEKTGWTSRTNWKDRR